MRDGAGLSGTTRSRRNGPSHPSITRGGSCKAAFRRPRSAPGDVLKLSLPEAIASSDLRDAGAHHAIAITKRVRRTIHAPGRPPHTVRTLSLVLARPES